MELSCNPRFTLRDNTRNRLSPKDFSARIRSFEHLAILNKGPHVMTSDWQNLQKVSSKKFVCGYCSSDISSEIGYWSNFSAKRIYICHHCDHPTYIFQQMQVPGTLYGYTVASIDEENISKLYYEARKCFGESAFTASVLCCRKLLMHIAVSKGAKENLAFIRYVEYLSDQNYIPPGAKTWVDHIRTKGNEANHEIIISTEDDARNLIDFIGIILKMIYEFPAKVSGKSAKK